MNIPRFEELCNKWIAESIRKGNATHRTAALELLGIKIGCGGKSIDNWIAGRQSPFESNWLRAAKVFGVDPEDLLLQPSTLAEERDSELMERIRSIWFKLSAPKQLFVKQLLDDRSQAELHSILAQEVTNKAMLVALPSSSSSHAHILMLLFAVSLMPRTISKAAYGQPHLAVFRYLADALSALLEKDLPILAAYSEYRSQHPDDQEFESYAEAYAMWVEKTASYLQDCRGTVRALSYNEFPEVWDKPGGTAYLATHYLLRIERKCDLRRVFVYDSTYWQNPGLLRRLAVEVMLQTAVGVNVRVCSREQLNQQGKGYYYPLKSFGTYDRFAMGVLLPHPKGAMVKIIHGRHQIADAIQVLDSVYDAAEPSDMWARKHCKSVLGITDVVSKKVDAVKKVAQTQHLP